MHRPGEDTINVYPKKFVVPVSLGPDNVWLGGMWRQSDHFTRLSADDDYYFCDKSSTMKCRPSSGQQPSNCLTVNTNVMMSLK